MYAYLQVMAIGFRGLKIHQEARRVEQILGELGSRFERFQEHFGKIGRHLDSAKAQFDGALKDVQRFETTLQGLKIGRLESQEPLMELSTSKASDEIR
jgi:DNA anti-recombination protein RmuC